MVQADVPLALMEYKSLSYSHGAGRGPRSEERLLDQNDNVFMAARFVCIDIFLPGRVNEVERAPCLAICCRILPLSPVWPRMTRFDAVGTGSCRGDRTTRPVYHHRNSDKLRVSCLPSCMVIRSVIGVSASLLPLADREVIDHQTNKVSLVLDARPCLLAGDHGRTWQACIIRMISRTAGPSVAGLED
jgi:hypothetical protein